MHGKSGQKCWEIDPSLTPCIEPFRSNTIELSKKIYFCTTCFYYKYMNPKNNSAMNQPSGHERNRSPETVGTLS